MAADLIELGRRAPLVGVLGAVRVLPELIAQLPHGERPPKAHETMRLRDMAELPRAQGGWNRSASAPVSSWRSV